MTRSDKKKVFFTTKRIQICLKIVKSYFIIIVLVLHIKTSTRWNSLCSKAIKRAKKFKHFTTSLWSQGILQLYTTTRQQGFSWDSLAVLWPSMQRPCIWWYSSSHVWSRVVCHWCRVRWGACWSSRIPAPQSVENCTSSLALGLLSRWPSGNEYLPRRLLCHVWSLAFQLIHTFS